MTALYADIDFGSHFSDLAIHGPINSIRISRNGIGFLEIFPSTLRTADCKVAF
jgi:hypothetical protein